MAADAFRLLVPVGIGLLAGLLVLAGSVVLGRRALSRAREAAGRIRSETRAEGENKAKEILLAAQEKVLALEEEVDRRERELDARDAAAEARAAEHERARAALERERQDLARRQAELARARQALADTQEAARADRQEARKALERIAGLSAADARAELIAGIEADAQREAERLARKIHDQARERAEQEAMLLAVQATQRINVKKAVETTVSAVELPSDEMKGRIIGREGRNIRAIEAATGIDLIVDDTPRSILISSFDPVRREIARIAIGRLIEDGRIHPARIEEVVERVRSEIDGIVEESGAQAALDLGVSDLHPRLNRLVGWMKLRSHHGQNLLQHCVEVAWVGGFMASEVGARVDLVRRAALLHEIGRADPESTGPAILASAEIAGRLGEAEEVVHAIRSLHREVEARNLEALLLQTADRLSTGRPGARKENLDVFIERLRRLEAIAQSFPGVRQAYAVKAGKELAVLVDAAGVGDQETFALSKKIARALEKDLPFQGKIRVSVLRETRAVHYAV